MIEALFFVSIMTYFENDRIQRESARWRVNTPQSSAYLITREALFSEINRLLEEGQDFYVEHLKGIVKS